MLPDGHNVPAHEYPGITLQEHFDNYWSHNFGNQGSRHPPQPQQQQQQQQTNQQQPTQQQQNQVPNTSTNFLETDKEYIFSLDVDSLTPLVCSDSDKETNDCIKALQAEIFALQEAKTKKPSAGPSGKTVKFDGLPLLHHAKKSGNGSDDKDLGNNNDSTKTTHPNSRPSSSQLAPTIFAHLVLKPPVTILKKGAPVPDELKAGGGSEKSSKKPTKKSSDRPTECPKGLMKQLNTPSKSANDLKLHFQSPVESGFKAKSLLDRILNGQITILTKELLVISPEMHHQMKEQVSSKKVSHSVNFSKIITEDGEELIHVNGYLSAFSSLLEPTPPEINWGTHEFSSTAPVSLPLRVIYPIFAEGVQPECILDGGLQNVIM